MKLNKKIRCGTLLLAFFSMIAAFFVAEEHVLANRFYSELVGGAPLIHSWSDISQINADDDWSGVVSFQAYRGDDLTTAIGIDPQTILADGHSTPLDVNANQTNPNTFSTGGAAEFQIADPTVALKGSGTADAPHLMIYLDTTPCPLTKSLSIRYNVRDIDGSANDAIQQVALHYRIGTTGDFTNVPAGYVADATDPNAATKVTQRIVNLPATLINNPQVELRIMTTNAAGTDEWVGIDDIEVGCYFPTTARVAAGGRVLSSNGQGIANANVSFLNTNTIETVNLRTNQFGYFAIEDLAAGDIYIVTVGHKQFVFSNNTQAFRLTKDLKDILFYADAPPQSKQSGHRFLRKN